MAKSKVAIGAFIAAAAGFVTGVLLAPKSGKETQKEVKQAADTAKKKVAGEYKAVRGKVETKVAEVKKTVKKTAKKIPAAKK